MVMRDASLPVPSHPGRTEYGTVRVSSAIVFLARIEIWELLQLGDTYVRIGDKAAVRRST